MHAYARKRNLHLEKLLPDCHASSVAEDIHARERPRHGEWHAHETRGKNRDEIQKLVEDPVRGLAQERCYDHLQGARRNVFVEDYFLRGGRGRGECRHSGVPQKVVL